LSFALEKASKVTTIAAVLCSQDPAIAAALEENKVSIAKRREFKSASDDTVRKHVAAITPDMLDRRSPFSIRKEIPA
jgi:5-methyltetrahydropteroyltriglutamate--homocysteine methyltransferase